MPNRADCGEFNCGNKCFMIINPSFLMKSFINESRFAPVGETVSRGLGFIDPFTTNDRSIRRSWNQLLGLILYQHIEFILHSFYPFRLLGG